MSLPIETVLSASAVSWVLSIDVLRSASPWTPLAAPADAGERAQHRGQLQVVEPPFDRLGEEDALGDLLGDALVGEDLIDLVPGAGEQDVAGEELAHVLGDPVDRVGAALLAERGRDVVGDPGERVAAQLVGLDELRLGAGELIGRVEPLDPLQQGLGGAAVGGDLRLEVERVGVRRRVLEALEELARELVRLLDDRLQVRGVVLEPAFLAGVQAALDREQQEDDQDHADPERDHAAQHQLTLAFGPRTAGPRA